MPAQPAFADFGPFFAVEVHAPGASCAASWRPFTELTSDRTMLAARIDTVRRALAAGSSQDVTAVDRRVAASVAHLGLVARLVAPGIAAAVLGERVGFDAASLWWRDELGGPFPLSVPHSPRGRGDQGELSTVVSAVTDAVAADAGVSRHVLGGNVASAINSAARMVAAARPDLAGTARAVADAMLADPGLEGGVLRSGPGFRRRSCCLIYRVAGDRTAICGDCVLG